MPREIEAKFALDSHDPLLARLHALGLTPHRRLLQRDTFFDRPDHALRDSDIGLRLRQQTDLDANETTHLITYKGPRDPHAAFKDRLELEFAVSDSLAASAFLQQLGFAPTLAFEKRRILYHVQDCEICLDHVARLGRFVEIEGPSPDAIAAVRNTLGLADAPLTQEPYVRLVADLLDRESPASHECFF